MRVTAEFLSVSSKNSHFKFSSPILLILTGGSLATDTNTFRGRERQRERGED